MPAEHGRAAALPEPCQGRGTRMPRGTRERQTGEAYERVAEDAPSQYDTKEGLLARVPEGELACRANYHPLPVLWPNSKRVPRGFRAVRMPRAGKYQVIRTCPQCGLVETYVQGPDGTRENVRRYYPANWIRFRRDMEVRKDDFRRTNAEYEGSQLERFAVDPEDEPNGDS